MTKMNPHLGSTFESWLDEAGIHGEVTAAAVKAVIAAQQRITKARMAEMMQTSRAELNRLLDPDGGGDVAPTRTNSRRPSRSHRKRGRTWRQMKRG